MITLLMVCTGNICRSAYAERMLQKRLDVVAPGAFLVRSAGTHAMVGHPIEQTAAARLTDGGGNDAEFSARQLSEGILSDVELALAMTEEHRTAVARVSPRMLKRAFTIREFAAIIEEVEADPTIVLPPGHDAAATADRWARLREVAILKRHAARNRLNGILDIEDPYMRGEAAFDSMVHDLEPLLATIVRFESRHA